jgi:two-component system response regulator DesR
MKDTPNEELPGIIRRIAAGEKVFSSEIVQSIKSAPPALSERKREILRLVAKGFTSANIAKMLKISKYAVDQHLSATCEKLGASSRAEAVSIAINCNMIKT